MHRHIEFKKFMIRNLRHLLLYQNNMSFATDIWLLGHVAKAIQESLFQKLHVVFKTVDS